MTNSWGLNGSTTEGVSETIQKRALVTPDEVGRLFGDRDNPSALAVISGYQPMFLTRSFYFRENRLRGRYDAHPDHAPPLTLPKLAIVIKEEEAAAKASREKRERDAAQKLAEKERQARELEEWRAERKRAEQWELQREQLLWMLGITIPAIILLAMMHYLSR